VESDKFKKDPESIQEELGHVLCGVSELKPQGRAEGEAGSPQEAPDVGEDGVLLLTQLAGERPSGEGAGPQGLANGREGGRHYCPGWPISP